MTIRDHASKSNRSPELDASAGEPLEPTREDALSPELETGEPAGRDEGVTPDYAIDDSRRRLRNPEAEPERDDLAARADPPTGNLIPPETPERR